MAVLPDTDRVRVWKCVMRSLLGGVAGIDKTALRNAVNATDDWIDNNQNSFNNALPATFRNNATLAQKTTLFCAVALMRVSRAVLESVFGGSD